ncbi:MAG: DUF1353 domain-containing protein [Bacteroidales bacterium]|nr:DUF1353 domain-containing protein [Bacteroidales bacterium]
MDIIAGEIHLDYVDGEDDAELTRDFTCEIDGFTVRVPKGFVWDGASLPRGSYAIFGTPFDKRHRRASCLHDAIYRGVVWGIDRAEADAIYRNMLRMDGMGIFKAYVEWSAIRLFGGRYYKQGD